MVYLVSYDLLLKVCIKYEFVISSVVIEMLIVVVIGDVFRDFRLVVYFIIFGLSFRNFSVFMMVFFRGFVVRNVFVFFVGGGENVGLIRMWKYVLFGLVVYLVEVMFVVSVMVIGWFGVVLFIVVMVIIVFK